MQRIEADTAQFLANVNVRSMKHTIALLERHIARSQILQSASNRSIEDNDGSGTGTTMINSKIDPDTVPGDVLLELHTTVEIPLRGRMRPLCKEWRLHCVSLGQLQTHHSTKGTVHESLERLEPCTFLQQSFIDPLFGIVSHFHAQIASLRIRFRRATGYDWDTTIHKDILDSEHTKQLFDKSGIGILSKHDSVGKLYEKFMQIRHQRHHYEQDVVPSSSDESSMNTMIACSSSSSSSLSTVADSEAFSLAEPSTNPMAQPENHEQQQFIQQSNEAQPPPRKRPRVDEVSPNTARRRAKKERVKRLRKALL